VVARPLVVEGEAAGAGTDGHRRAAERHPAALAAERSGAFGVLGPLEPAEAHGLAHRLRVLELVAQDELVQEGWRPWRSRSSATRSRTAAR
jgi:hypothetical protein